MQLLILVLALFMCGKNAAAEDIKPLIESLGGEEAAQVIKQAEQLEKQISAVQACFGSGNVEPDSSRHSAGAWYPLSPVAAVADDKITYALSRYIATGD